MQEVNQPKQPDTGCFITETDVAPKNIKTPATNVPAKKDFAKTVYPRSTTNMKRIGGGPHLNKMRISMENMSPAFKSNRIKTNVKLKPYSARTSKKPPTPKVDIKYQEKLKSIITTTEALAKYGVESQEIYLNPIVVTREESDQVDILRMQYNAEKARYNNISIGIKELEAKRQFLKYKVGEVKEPQIIQEMKCKLRSKEINRDDLLEQQEDLTSDNDIYVKLMERIKIGTVNMKKPFQLIQNELRNVDVAIREQIKAFRNDAKIVEKEQIETELVGKKLDEDEWQFEKKCVQYILNDYNNSVKYNEIGRYLKSSHEKEVKEQASKLNKLNEKH